MAEENIWKDHEGNTNPIRGKHGAIVKLKSGDRGIIAPRDNEEYDFDFEIAWFQTGDNDDTVAYKQTPRLADEIVREIEAYFNQEEALENDPIRDHYLMRMAVINSAKACASASRLTKQVGPTMIALPTPND